MNKMYKLLLIPLEKNSKELPLWLLLIGFQLLDMQIKLLSSRKERYLRSEIMRASWETFLMASMPTLSSNKKLLKMRINISTMKVIINITRLITNLLSCSHILMITKQEIKKDKYLLLHYTWMNLSIQREAKLLTKNKILLHQTKMKLKSQ